MNFDGLGSSIAIAVAAVLWFVYLVPTWLRRREYLSTERNAVRLQQTLRILAETAEVPDAVRAESTARTVAHHQKVLRAAEAAAEARRAAEAERLAAELRASAAASGADQLARDRASARRLRRNRGLTTLVLFVSLITALVGVAPALAGNWLVLGSAIAVAVGAVAMLNQMAAVSRARAQRLRGARPVSQPKRTVSAPPVAKPQQDRSWTPVPLPKPLYLTHQPEPMRMPLEPAESLKEAIAASERALREAQASPKVTRIDRPAASAPKSRFASMGIVDEADAPVADLDAILSRRRAVG